MAFARLNHTELLRKSPALWAVQQTPPAPDSFHRAGLFTARLLHARQIIGKCLQVMILQLALREFRHPRLRVMLFWIANVLDNPVARSFGSDLCKCGTSPHSSHWPAPRHSPARSTGPTGASRRRPASASTGWLPSGTRPTRHTLSTCG
jgi:hypothetical protein